MQIREFASALLRHWRWAVSGLLLGLLAAIGVLLMSSPVYTSSTRLFLTTPGWGGPTTLGNSDSSPFQGDEFSQQRAQTYVRLVQGDNFSSLVSQRLGGSVDSATIARHLDARVIPDTVLIEITAGDVTATVARDIAVAASAELVATIETLEIPAGTQISTVQPVAIDSPVVATEPSSPRPILVLVVGLTFGVLLGLSAVVLRVKASNTVDTAQDLASVIGVPVLGATAPSRSADTQARFDEIRYNLEYLAPKFSGGLLVVTSARDHDGKTSTVSGLAEAFSRAGRSVLTICGDLRDPGRAGTTIGLTNVMTGDVRLGDAVVVVGAVSTLASGALPIEPSMVLESSALRTVFDQARSDYDVVLVDSPDLGRFDDARTLARSADATMIVVSAGTEASTLREAVRALNTVGVEPAGAILTHSGATSPRFGYLAAAEQTDHYSDHQNTETVTR